MNVQIKNMRSTINTKIEVIGENLIVSSMTFMLFSDRDLFLLVFSFVSNDINSLKFIFVLNTYKNTA